MEIEHLLQMSKCSIFHNIFKYMIFQRRQKALLWSKGLNRKLTHPLDKGGKFIKLKWVDRNSVVPLKLNVVI